MSMSNAANNTIDPNNFTGMLDKPVEYLQNQTHLTVMMRSTISIFWRFGEGEGGPLNEIKVMTTKTKVPPILGALGVVVGA
jgi:hypothetical protein